MLRNVLMVLLGVLFVSGNAFSMPKVVETIASGGAPVGLAVDEKNNRVFVANAHENKILVIDGQANKVIKKISNSAPNPIDGSMGGNGLSYNPDEDKLYLPVDNTMVIINTASFKIEKTVLNKKGENGWMPSIHFLKNSKEIALLDWYGNIQIYDTRGNFKRESTTDFKDSKKYPAITGDEGTLYFTGEEGLVAISMRSGKMKNRIKVQAKSIPLIDEKTGFLFVGGGGKLLKVSDREEVGSLDIAFPDLMGTGMAMNPNTRRLFAPSGEDSVAVIDPDRMEVLSMIKVGKNPRSIAVNTKTNMVYVACKKDGKVFVIKDE